jgi:hypothetical protein
MSSDDKRRYPRLDRRYLVSYEQFDVNTLDDEQGMGRTVNMSVRGLLLQLPRPVDMGTTLCVSLAIEGEIADVIGKVVHCVENEAGLYEAGLELQYVPPKFSRQVETFLESQVES